MPRPDFNYSDPNSLFNQLIKEAADAAGADESTDKVDADEGDGSLDKVAAVVGDLVLDQEFFAKVAANDAEANEAFASLVTRAMDNGATPEEVEAYIANAEAEALGEGAGAGGEGGGDDDDPGDMSEFELARAEAEAAAIEQAIDDELAENEIAKVAGIDRETIEAWLINEGAGEAYFHGRSEVRDIVEKIASVIIPDDDLVDAAVKEAEAAGLDVSAIKAEIEQLSKEASAQPAESATAKKARELAEAESALVESLSVLKMAGFDVEKLAEEAEQKKRMSAGKKALIGAGALGAGLGGGLLLKRHSGTLATGAVSAANKARGLGQQARNQAALFLMPRRK